MTPSFSRLQQKRDPESNQHRYYILDLQPYLFGVWGRRRHLSQMRVELCSTREEAERVFGTKLREKRRCQHT
jgi:predicted DNA-binding WGR domain protein